MDEPNTLRGRWVTMLDAIQWVAFRDRLAIDDWGSFSSAKLNRPWPEWGMPFGWNEGCTYPDGVLAALRARAGGKAWQAPQNRREQAYKARAGARRIICQTGDDPKALADQLEADIRGARSMDAALEDAKRGINESVRDEQIEAFGRRAGVDRKALVNAVHELIDAKLLIGPRVIEFDGTLMEDTEKPFSEIKGYTGPYFADIRFRVDDVHKLWPPTALATTLPRPREIIRQMRGLGPIPDGFIEFSDVANLVRGMRYGADAEPDLNPAEYAILREGRPGWRKNYLSMLPGESEYIYDLALSQNRPLNEAYEKVTARQVMIQRQDSAAIDWLHSKDALVVLPDGRNIVPLDSLDRLRDLYHAWALVEGRKATVTGAASASPTPGTVPDFVATGSALQGSTTELPNQALAPSPTIPFDGPGYPPTGVLPGTLEMTACEVLCWIGYGRAIPKEVYFQPILRGLARGMSHNEIACLLHESIPEEKPQYYPLDEAERTLMDALRSNLLKVWYDDAGVLHEVRAETYRYALCVNVRGAIEVDQDAEKRDRDRADKYRRSAAFKSKGAIVFRTEDIRQHLVAWTKPSPIAESYTQTEVGAIDPTPNASSVSPSMPVADQFSAEAFATASDKLPLLTEWAKCYYAEKPSPSRDEMLKDHRAQFGTILHISEPVIRKVLTAVWPNRAGGAPSHSVRRVR